MKQILAFLSKALKAVTNLTTVKNWITIGGFVVMVSVLFLQRCNYEKRLSQKDVALDSLTLANQRFDSTVNKLGQTVTTQTAIITNNQNQLKQLAADKFNLKNSYEKKIKQITAYYSQITKTKIDSTKLPFTDTTAQKKFSDSLENSCKVVIKYMKDSTLTVPKTDSIQTKDFSFNYTINKTGLTINSLEIPDSQYFRIVTIKGGFFRKVNGKLKFHVPMTVKFQSLHTNPLIHVTGETSVLYQPDKKPKVLWQAIKAGALIYLGSRL